jgi:hypothetical protein
VTIQQVELLLALLDALPEKIPMGKKFAYCVYTSPGYAIFEDSPAGRAAALKLAYEWSIGPLNFPIQVTTPQP